MSTYALLIGIAIWAAFIGACGLYAVQRRRWLRKNPQAKTSQQVWEESTPEERAEATRTALFWRLAGGGAGPGASSGC